LEQVVVLVTDTDYNILYQQADSHYLFPPKIKLPSQLATLDAKSAFHSYSQALDFELQLNQIISNIEKAHFIPA